MKDAEIKKRLNGINEEGIKTQLYRDLETLYHIYPIHERVSKAAEEMLYNLLNSKNAISDFTELIYHNGFRDPYFHISEEEYNSLIKRILDNLSFLDESPSIEIPVVVKDLSDEIIFQITNNPALMYQIEPRLFEELIEKCMKKMGMHTELTKQTRDGGIDIIAFEDTKFTKNHYIIECKRYNPDHKVGISYVQRLYGVKQDIKATKAFLVTSSSFTSPALEFEKLHQWEMELKAGKDVEKWLNTYWGKK